MTLFKSFTLMIFLSISWQRAETIETKYSLRGTVIFRETGKPVTQAYIYTVKGEEETLTDHKGEFEFTSWQNLPVTLHVDYPVQKFQLVITDPAKKIRIEL